MPATHFTANCADNSSINFNDSTKRSVTTGSITDTSSCAPAAACSMVKLFPETRKYNWFMASGKTGLTLPGIMEDPAWSSGKMISPKPPRGPLESSLKSPAILDKSTHKAVRLWESETKSVLLLAWDIRLAAGLKGSLVTFLSSL